MPLTHQQDCIHLLMPLSVVDDSSLHQAKDVELKGKWARQDKQSSLMRRQVMCLLLKTAVERSKPLCLYARQERSCHTGE
jgi:hypothetical protein